MLSDILNQLSAILRAGTVWAPLIVFIGGVLTSINPCSLSMIPLIIGVVGGEKEPDKKTAYKLTFAFISGMTISFAVLGMLASALGRMLSLAGRWYYLTLGTLMVVMALETWGITNFIKGRRITGSGSNGVIGSFLAGIVGGVFASPCATPMMIALMSVVAGGGVGQIMGMFLFVCFALGHGIILAIAGVSLNAVRMLESDDGFQRLSKWISTALGFAILSLGLYMFYLGF